MPSGASHRERLDRSIQFVHAGLLFTFAIVVTGTGSSQDRAGFVAHAVVAAGLVVLAALTAWRGERALHLALTVPVALFAATQWFYAPGDVSLGLCQVACLLLAARTMGSIGFSVVFVGVIGLQVAVGLASGAEFSANTWGTMLLGVANTYVAATFAGALERSTEAMDLAERQSAEATRALASVRAQQGAVDSVRRVLHDEVLTALRFVAEGAQGMGREPQTWTDRARGLAGEAVASVGDLLGGVTEARVAPGATEPGAGLQALIRTARAAAPIEVEVDVEASLEWRLGWEADQALARAVAEAIRNVHRHARVDAARLNIRELPGTVEVTVSDLGIGLRPDAVEGVGLAESVRRPVVQAGGQVEVRPGPDGGTTVILSVPSTPADDADPVTRTYHLTMAAGARPELVARSIVPMAMVSTLIGCVVAFSTGPLVGHLLLVAGNLAVSFAVSHRLRSRGPSRWWLLSVFAAVIAMQVYGLTILPPSGLLDLRSWAVAGVTSPLLFVAFVIPVRWSAGILVVMLGLVAAVTWWAPELADGRQPVSTYNAVSLPWLTVAIGVVLRRNAALVTRLTASASATAVELVRREALGRASSTHLDHTRAVAVPWLATLADPAAGVDPAAEETRRAALLLMLEVRDDLYAPGFHGRGLRRLTTGLRSRGSVLEIRPGLPAGAYRRPSGLVVMRLCESLPGGYRVTVSAPQRRGGRTTQDQIRTAQFQPAEAVTSEVRIVVVPTPMPGLVAELATLPGVRCRGDEVALTIEIEDEEE